TTRHRVRLLLRRRVVRELHGHAGRELRRPVHLQPQALSPPGIGAGRSAWPRRGRRRAIRALPSVYGGGALSATAQTAGEAGPVLVATKLHVPELRGDFVSRPELVARLCSGDSKLTLICAPAGWGKTILLTEWRSSPDEERPFAWVSL